MPSMVKPASRRVAVLLTLIMLAILILVARIGWLQFVEGRRLADRMKSQLRDTRILQSPRGTIYDINGRELAISSMRQSLYADPQELSLPPDEAARLLAAIIDVDVDEIRERLSIKGRFVWLRRTLEPEVTQKVRDLIKTKKIHGLHFLEESKRYYPNGPFASQVLGFVGTDDIGLDGVEMVYDKFMHGEISRHVLETDNQGVPILQSVFQSQPRREKSLVLTIDITIQHIVEKTLDKVVAQSKPQGASVILMNPRTGAILAMANRPHYDPNFFYRYSPQEWKNRSLSFVYEPGSTFKTIIAAAALQEGLVTPSETFEDAGEITAGGVTVHNWDSKGHGRVTFADITKYSINTGFIQIGQRLGEERLMRYTRNFGFGQATDISLPGEEYGLLFDPKRMTPSDLASTSIGQGIAVTPLQLLTALAAVANEGVLVKPFIVKEIRNADGTLVTETPVKPVRQVISPATARTLTNLLEKVVAEGGGAKAAVKGYRFVGKTGTAEKLKQGGVGYAEGRYIASFAGYGPAEDPQVVALVVIDDPVGAYYGGEVAAPVFSEIMTQVMWYLNMKQQARETGKHPILPSQSGTRAIASDQTMVPVGRIIVPDLLGQSIRQAGETSNKAGLSFVPIGSGVAVHQSLPPFAVVEPNTEITVTFEPRDGDGS